MYWEKRTSSYRYTIIYGANAGFGVNHLIMKQRRKREKKLEIPISFERRRSGSNVLLGVLFDISLSVLPTAKHQSRYSISIHLYHLRLYIVSGQERNRVNGAVCKGK